MFDAGKYAQAEAAAAPGGVWYSGNIYDAVNGAERYNRDGRDAFFTRAEREFTEGTGVSPFFIAVPY